MNQIKNLLKTSPIAMVVVGLVVAGVASASLVTYLANDVIATNTVVSPIKMSVNEGRNGASTGNTSVTIDSFGADTFFYTTVSKNQSNGDVEGYAVTVIDQTDIGCTDDGNCLTGKEFTKITAEAKGNSFVYDILNEMYVVHTDGSLTQLISKTWDNPKLVTTICYPVVGVNTCTDANRDAIKGTITGGDTTWLVSTFTLDQATVGTYTVKGQFADDLAKYAAEQYAL